MLARALRKITPKAKKADTVQSDYDETGIDVVEAINFVIADYEKDVSGSKEFNEKEISISSLKAKQIFRHDEKLCNKIPEFKQIKQGSSDHRLTLSKTVSDNLPSRTTSIGTITKKKLENGKIKAKRKIEENTTQFFSFLKNINSIRRYQNFDQELSNEFILNHKLKSRSLEKFSVTENLGSKTIIFPAKYFSNHNHWISCKVLWLEEKRAITISDNYSENISLNINDIKGVWVEENRRVAWIKNAVNNQLGILMENIKDVEYLMMILDFFWKISCKQPNLFMNCDKYLKCCDSPLLHSTNIKWRRASHQVMEFLGRYCYHLKTAQKEIKSLQAVNIYLKAGYLYIYELDTSLLPFFTMSVAGANTTVNRGWENWFPAAGQFSDSCSLTIETVGRENAETDRGKEFLVIFVDILAEALRAEHLISSSNNCKNNEVEIGSSARLYRVGICNDRLVWDPVNINENNIEEQEHTGKCVEENFTVIHRNLLHVAVDKNQLELMLAWGPGHNKTYQECPGTGGSGVFSSLEDMLKFLQTLESCSDLKVLYVNSCKISILP